MLRCNIRHSVAAPCSFMEVLAGNDASSGVPMVARDALSAAATPVIDNVRSGLYDALMLGYLRGYTGDERHSVCAYDPALHAAAYCLVRLAIIVMADYCA